MCGIAGFIPTPDRVAQDGRQAVQAMCARMATRGPDAEGIWFDERAILGHRRLAILDLDARANQPMAWADGRYVIVLNGEIYNFRELRQSLEADGVTFRTTSDTEVVVALYARDGERMLRRLRGMFALAIWDTQARELFLARDPYGIKPLYYSRTGSGFVFASQVKAIVASGLVPRTTEPAAVAGFYLWGSVPEPWTIIQDVLALPAGCWMRVRDGRPGDPVRWHDIREHFTTAAARYDPREIQERVRASVVDSVRAHLVADVPVCVFLSGGIDSGTMVGLTSELGTRNAGITVAFDEFTGHAEDETPVAARVAALYGVPHHVRRVGRAEFESAVPRILRAMDQPSVDGVNTWFASLAAAEQGFKVVLSGLGGDELFCGYPSFRQIPRAARLGRFIAAVPGARALLGLSGRALASAMGQPKFGAIPRFMDSIDGLYFLRRGLFLPEELPDLIGRDAAEAGLARLGGALAGVASDGARDGASAVALLESTRFMRNQLLRDSDWASMDHSLELRTPLVDATLLAALGPCVPEFATHSGKRMLALAPAVPLPDAIIDRPKTGFAMPMSQWLADSGRTNAWARIPMLARPGTPWARRWAACVMEHFTSCE